MTKITVKSLITEGGLGYCCPWIFYSRYKSTTLIAARLGMSVRAVEYGMNSFRKGEFKCEGKPNCMVKIMRRPLLAGCNASAQTGLQTDLLSEEEA